MEPLIEAGAPANTVYTFTAFAFAAAMLWEMLAPRRTLTANTTRRWFGNFTLSAVTWFTTALFSTWCMLWLAGLAAGADLGVLRQVNAGPVASFLVLLLSTQLLSYYVHVAFHNISWLWPIHAVHHSDVDVDMSTSYRHHPLEPLVSLPLAAPLMLFLGVAPEVVAAYRVFEVAATIFSHSNVRIPESIEKYLRYIVLTPDFHRLHHCSDIRFTNSNYGSLLPLFDYVHGTARQRPYPEHEDMELGLEILRNTEDSRIDRLLLTPLLMSQAERKRASSR
jgi:sterol desaturase/sphingolipid hydroxylase (fatty acid hydroxylase superfamily)